MFVYNYILCIIYCVKLLYILYKLINNYIYYIIKLLYKLLYNCINYYIRWNKREKVFFINTIGCNKIMNSIANV